MANIKKIEKMQHTWETQVKPFVEDLIAKEDGQYAAMVLVAHGCEHAYKAIRKRRAGMQESLKSVLRLHDFLQVHSRNRSAAADVTNHWGKTDAHKIRAFIVNPWKHEGALKGEKTNLINDPRGVLSGYSVSLSRLRDVRPLEINELKMDFDAHDIARKLVSGIDSAYAIFLNASSPLQHKE